jgi:hypothetical protein
LSLGRNGSQKFREVARRCEISEVFAHLSHVSTVSRSKTRALGHESTDLTKSLSVRRMRSAISDEYIASYDSLLWIIPNSGGN